MTDKDVGRMESEVKAATLERMAAETMNTTGKKPRKWKTCEHEKRKMKNITK